MAVGKWLSRRGMSAVHYSGLQMGLQCLDFHLDFPDGQTVTINCARANILSRLVTLLTFHVFRG